jgi:HD-like signal output (HDOD) protein
MPPTPVATAAYGSVGTKSQLLRLPHEPPNEELHLEVAMLLVADIEAGRLDIPPLPRTALELSRLVSAQDARIESVVRLVERDVQLAGRVLRLASSAAFGREKVYELRRAIVRIGMSGVRNIALSVAVAKAFRAGPLEPYLKLETRHAYVTACGAAWLARRLGGDPEHAFLCGLMHDVGCPALLAMVAKRARYEPALMNIDVIMALLHQLHADVGSTVLGYWGLAQSVREVAQLHHLAHLQTHPTPIMLAVALADAADESQAPDAVERVKFLVDHPVRHLAKVTEEDLAGLGKVIDEAAQDEALRSLTR